MGNKIEISKVEESIHTLCKNKNLENNIINNEFIRLYEAINFTVKNNKEFISAITSLVNEMKEEYILNLLNNIVKFLRIQQNENLKIFRQTLYFLSSILEIIYMKFNNLREIIILSISILMYECVNMLIC